MEYLLIKADTYFACNRCLVDIPADFDHFPYLQYRKGYRVPCATKMFLMCDEMYTCMYLCCLDSLVWDGEHFPTYLIRKHMLSVSGCQKIALCVRAKPDIC